MKPDESLVVVLFAGAMNLLQAVLKFGVYLVTGSPAMLATTYHSVSDTGNQLLLLLGYYYSNKEASRRHPFGYGKAKFFYSFLVSVLLFGIAGWESLKTGFDALLAGAPTGIESGTVSAFDVEFPAVYLAYLVMCLALVFDGLSYLKAKHALDRESRVRGWRGIADAFRRTSDMPVLAVLTENAVAVVGGLVALAGIFLADVTGVAAFDAAAAVLLGLLLMAFALALGWENKRLLLGEALSSRHETSIEDVVTNADGVEELHDLRTVYFGPDSVLVTADVEFDPALDADGVERLIDEIERDIHEKEPLVDDVYIEPENES